jgi:hypothetical protein
METTKERIARCKTFANADDIIWLAETAERFEVLTKQYLDLKVENSKNLSSLHNTNEIALETDQQNKNLRKMRKIVADANQINLEKKDNEISRLRKALQSIEEATTLEDAKTTAKEATENVLKNSSITKIQDTLIIYDFKRVTAMLPDNTPIKMSNHNLDYTLSNPDCANNGSIHYDGYALVFAIDWNNNRTVTLGDFKDLVEKHQLEDTADLSSVDVDDNNTINFGHVLLLNNSIVLL